MYINSYDRNSSVSRVTRLRDGGQGSRLVPDMVIHICVIRNVETGHMAYPATCTVITGDSPVATHSDHKSDSSLPPSGGVKKTQRYIYAVP